MHKVPKIDKIPATCAILKYQMVSLALGKSKIIKRLDRKTIWFFQVFTLHSFFTDCDTCVL